MWEVIFVALLFYRPKHLFVYQVPHLFSCNFYKDQFKFKKQVQRIVKKRKVDCLGNQLSKTY